MDADPLDAEHLGEDGAECFLRLRARRRVNGHRRDLGMRQGLAVDLAARRQRNGFDGHEGRRHHIVRQSFRKMAAQLHGIEIPDDISAQPALPFLAEGVDESVLHRRVLPEGAFDLAQLNTEAADLDLLVDACPDTRYSRLQASVPGRRSCTSGLQQRGWE